MNDETAGDPEAAEGGADLTYSPALRAVEEIATTFRQWQQSHTTALSQARAMAKRAADSVGPWLAKVVAAIGRTVGEVYRQSAPPNWLIDNTIPTFSYVDAVRMTLDEGIPLAWAADPETVAALMAVPGDQPDRRAALRSTLLERIEPVLDHAEARLDELARASSTTTQQHASIDIAQQSIRALRADLPAPAQSAAANLIDHLVQRLFAPLEKTGKLSYRAKREQAESLLGLANVTSVTFYAVLRETATLLALPRALTDWWPNQNQPLPDGFSRHTTTHAITEPHQVNRHNALISIMLAVSLICQEADSEWSALRAFVWKDEDAQRHLLDVLARRQAALTAHPAHVQTPGGDAT